MTDEPVVAPVDPAAVAESTPIASDPIVTSQEVTPVEAAVADVEVAAVDEKKAIENSGHSHLYRMLEWLKKEFAEVGVDIKKLIEKI